MIFDSDGNSGEFVDLVAEGLNYLGPKDLTQYFIRQTSMNKTMKGSIKVEVVLGRRLLGTVLTVYIPTILLIFIAHTTNYFKSFFFEAVVSVNLTVMLVLTSMLISVVESLPRTAYMKMVEIWLIFNLLLPFADVILHTTIDCLRHLTHPLLLQLFIMIVPGQILRKSEKLTNMGTQ